MKKALLSLLQQLEKIEDDYDGLGDTNIREHMGDDIHRRGVLGQTPRS